VVQHKSDTSEEDLERIFKSGLISFCEMAHSLGIQITPYREDTWEKFRTLPTTLKKDAFRKFSSYSHVCISASKAGFRLDDDRQLTWWVLKELKLRPCSDFFDKLEVDDVLEIYNADGIQIHRNWAFFYISGYTLGDLFIYPWVELYQRDAGPIEHLMNQAAKCLSGEVRSTFPYGIGQHRIQELLSPTKNVMDISFKYLSPLFNEAGKPVAFFITSRVEKISSDAPPVDDSHILTTPESGTKRGRTHLAVVR
jgi:PAS domain-containing protein